MVKETKKLNCKKIRASIMSLLALLFAQVSAQELCRFEVSADKTDRYDCPVSLPVDMFNYNTDSLKLSLYEIKGNTETDVPVQLETAAGARIWFILKGYTPKNTKRIFVLRKTPNPPGFRPGITVVNKDGALRMFSGERPVVNYQMKTIDPPEGVSLLYRRSAFLHPLFSPGGEILTRIQAPDHYHHYGIWNPWTLTFIGRREVDFWNLSKGEGTVRFAGLVSQVEGPVFSGFRSLQEHIYFKPKDADSIAINELFEVRVWNIPNKRYMLDYISTLNTPLDSGILLAAYRYGGGIGFRATEKWTRDNSTVLTSEGRTRKDADGNNARWCMVEGQSAVKEGRSGILFLSYPANRMHPEPMRVWPLDANDGRGDVYFEFCPIRNKDWKLDRGNDYTLRYRLVIFDGKMIPDEAETYWQSFASPPQVSIISNTSSRKF